jgi:hypothetical protein
MCTTTNDWERGTIVHEDGTRRNATRAPEGFVYEVTPDGLRHVYAEKMMASFTPDVRPEPIDRLTDDEPTPDDELWNDVEHDERCCMDGTFRSPANGCPGVAELYRIEREDPSGDE